MEVVMKTSLMILVVLLLAVGGALGVMNNACKTGHGANRSQQAGT